MRRLEGKVSTKAEQVALQRSPRLAFEHFRVGSEWLYRKSAMHDPTQVRVLRVGEQRPVRVKIEFLDDQFEGLRAWVTTGALKVPWAARAEFVDNDDRWTTLLSQSPGKALVQTISDALIEPYIDASLLELLQADETSAALVHDVEALASVLELQADDLVDQLGWEEDGSLVVSWTVVARVGQVIARGRGKSAALELARESAQYLAEFRGIVRSRLARVNDATPDHRGLRLATEHHRELVEVLGQWTGEDLVRPTDRYLEVYDQLQEARELLALALPLLVPLGRRVGARELIEDIREFNERVI